MKPHRLFCRAFPGLVLLLMSLRCGGGGGSSTPPPQTPPDIPTVVELGYRQGRVAGIVGMPLTPVIPSYGSFRTYEVSPSLPLGLTLSPSTGVISGTPKVPSDFACTLKATGTGTVGTATLNIQVESPRIFAQAEVFRGEKGHLASVPVIEGFTYRWSIRNLDASAEVVGSVDGPILTYNTGPTLGSIELSVTMADASGLSFSSSQVQKVVGGKFLKDVRTSEQRAAFTATTLPDGRILLAGGAGNAGVALASAEIFDPYTDTWTPVGRMNQGRLYHSATLLADGRVLVAGGIGSGQTILASAEVFSPATETWDKVPEMPAAVKAHTATLLLGGEVLVAGGETLPIDGTPQISGMVFKFNPQKNQWMNMNPLKTPRKNHTAELDPKGSVILLGGEKNYWGITSENEIYYPENNSSGNFVPMAEPRSLHTSIMLKNGNILVVGGGYADGQPEYYDFNEKKWIKTNKMNNGVRNNPTATLMNDGRVLVVGGENIGDVDGIGEIYDPSTNAWTLTGKLNNVIRYNSKIIPIHKNRLLYVGGSNVYTLIYADPMIYEINSDRWNNIFPREMNRFLHSTQVTSAGDVYLAGGVGSFADRGDLNSVLKFDFWNGASWSLHSRLLQARKGHSALVTKHDELIVAGGSRPSVGPDSTEGFNPATKRWEALGSIPGNRVEGGELVTLSDGSAMICGGGDLYFHDSFNQTSRFDPVQKLWAPGVPMQQARHSHTASVLGDGSVLVTGGLEDDYDRPRLLNGVERYDPLKGEWKAATSLARFRMRHSATVMGDGGVLVVGGEDTQGAMVACERFDPVQGSWAAVSEMVQSRYWHSATLLPDGKLLVIGGVDGRFTLAGAELYDPATGTWSPAGSLNCSRASHTAVLLPDGKVLVVGGDLGYIPEFWKP